MARPIVNIEHTYVKDKKVEIAGIPCLSFSPAGKEEVPIIILYHGWKSNKEYQRFRATTIAAYGFRVIVPDALFHGERNAIDHTAPNALERYFWQVVVQSVEEAKAIIKHIDKSHNGPTRIGLMGHSMGGFIASGVFTANPEIRSLVVFNGSCAWLELEKIIREQAGEEPLCKDKRDEIRKYDPYNNLEKIQGRPILLLHGNSDTSVPIEGQRLFYNQAVKLYEEEPEKIEFIEVPNMNHYISTGMLAQGIEWCKKYL